jgi:hypothetical protein
MPLGGGEARSSLHKIGAADGHSPLLLQPHKGIEHRLGCIQVGQERPHRTDNDPLSWIWINATVASRVQLGWARCLSAAICKAYR